MSQAAVRVKAEERKGGGRVACVTIDNRRRLNCLLPHSSLNTRRAFEKLPMTRHCAPSC